MTGAAGTRRWGALPTKVLTLDLADGVSDLTGLGEHVFALVVVLVDGEPVGAVSVPVEGDRCPAESIADAVTAQLGDDLLRVALLAAMHAAPDGASPDLDDLVPFVRRDAAASGPVDDGRRVHPGPSGAVGAVPAGAALPAPCGGRRRRGQRTVDRRDGAARG